MAYLGLIPLLSLRRSQPFQAMASGSEAVQIDWEDRELIEVDINMLYKLLCIG